MPKSVQVESLSKFRDIGGLAPLAIVLALAWFGARHFGLFAYARPEHLRQLVERAQGWSWAAPAFVLAYIVVSTFGLPATPLTLAGGALFGVGAGTGLNWIGATLGATGAYFLARSLGGGRLRRLFGRNAATLDRMAGDRAFTALVRLRLIPVVPFNALNFGAGVAGVRPWPFVASTALGIIPGTAIYTYFADALLAGADGASRAAFLQVAVAGTLLIGLSFLPVLARRAGWVAAALVLAGAALPARGTAQSARMVRAAPRAGVTAAAHSPASVDHSSFDAMLAAYVTDGLVDYDAFLADPRFGEYLHQLDLVDPESLPETERLAYWINVYNAYTIELINSRHERASIRDISRWFGLAMKGPWTLPIVHAGGRVMTLDDVEHGIIRPTFKDPRVHAALVCAALGCPPLRSEAYVGGRINQQLGDQVRRFLAQRAKNRVDVVTRTVYGSPIFTWYRDDFGGTVADVGAFWAKYFPAGPARDLLRSGTFEWKDTAYDWSLNLRP